MIDQTHLVVQHVNAPDDETRGAYGFRLIGVPAAQALLVDAPAHWPLLKLDARIATDQDPTSDRVDEQTAVLRLRSGGWVSIDRRACTATFCVRALPDDGALVHPHLAGVAVVLAHWLGRDTFHAGGFIADGGVWGVLGAKEAGKSSLLAALSLSGVPVLSDDVLVLDGPSALAGPRSIDLRAPSADHLQAGEPLGRIGGRERWRLTLAAVPPELPLRGWVALGWSERIAVRRLRGSERLVRLGQHRGGRLYPPDPAGLIELSALPFLELHRPRSWQASREALDRLLDAIG
jgi:hypothetical protein